MSAALLGFLVGIPIGAVALCVIQALWPRPRRAWETYPPPRAFAATPRMHGKHAAERLTREAREAPAWFPSPVTEQPPAPPAPPPPPKHSHGMPVEIPEEDIP